MNLCDGKYTNHDLNPNSVSGHEFYGKDNSVLIRDVEAGEEILENYLTYERIEWLD